MPLTWFLSRRLQGRVFIGIVVCGRGLRVVETGEIGPGGGGGRDMSGGGGGGGGGGAEERDSCGGGGGSKGVEGALSTVNVKAGVFGVGFMVRAAAGGGGGGGGGGGKICFGALDLLSSCFIYYSNFNILSRT